MAFLLAGAAWSLFALLAGLISGTPALRTFGAAGFVLFIAAALLLDHFTASRFSWDEHVADEFDVDWSGFPDYRKDRAA